MAEINYLCDLIGLAKKFEGMMSSSPLEDRSHYFWQTFEVSLVDILFQKDDLFEFYWNSDIPVKEIASAFRIRNLSKVACIAGSAVRDDYRCARCSDMIPIGSREGLKYAMRYISRGFHNNYCAVCQAENRAYENRVIQAEEEKRDARLSELRRMPYREYLLTPEWKNTRSVALKRARFKCQVCSSKSNLHVHHRTYLRRGEEAVSDLTVLCATCHQTFHKLGSLENSGRDD